MRKLGRRFLVRLGPAVGRRIGGDAGISIVEVLAASLVLGIAIVGIAMMFGKGSAFVAASGHGRVAAGLAQQRIEQILAAGWDQATTRPPDVLRPPPYIGMNDNGMFIIDPPIDDNGTLIVDPLIDPTTRHTFTRTVCIQYVDAVETDPND